MRQETVALNSKAPETVTLCPTKPKITIPNSRVKRYQRPETVACPLKSSRVDWRSGVSRCTRCWSRESCLASASADAGLLPGTLMSNGSVAAECALALDFTRDQR
jgi:hypothetical protein